MSDQIENLVAAFLEHKDMEAAAEYVGRGRRFASLPLDELEDKWTEAFRALIVEGPASAPDADDIGAEMRLRGATPPVARVERELDEWKRDFQRLSQSTVSTDFQEQFREYRRARKAPSA